MSLPHRARRRGTLARREAVQGYLFMIPWFIGFTVFVLGPMLASLVLSLTDYQIFRPIHWYGLTNYTRMLSGQDELFYTSLYNTLYYICFTVPLTLVGGLTIALLLNQDILFVRVWRVLYYLPAVTAGVAVFLLWQWLLDPTAGLVNQVLSAVGLPKLRWLSDEQWAKPALILIALWGVGSGMVVWLAGLKAIPQHLYEAAKIDGAGRVARFWHVTLPMLSPTLFFQLIMTIIGTFQVFEAAYVLTSGGPVHATLFYVLYLFQQAFQYLRMGYASAMAWVLLLIVLALTFVNLKLSGRWVYYEGEVKK
jgi:multiple sugar transport system permease protein